LSIALNIEYCACIAETAVYTVMAADRATVVQVVSILGYYRHRKPSR